MRLPRTFVLVAPFVFALVLPPRLEARDSACDRTCLADVMTRYLASLVAHDPAQAPLARNARFTEDAMRLPIGGGL